MGKTLPELDNTNKLFLTYLKIPDQKKTHTHTHNTHPSIVLLGSHF